MKLFKISGLLLTALSFFFFSSCGDAETTTQSSSTGSETNQATTSNAISSNTSGEGQEYNSHYICPNRCAGSGSANAGNCPVCSTPYEHNDAWHQSAEAQAQQPQIQMEQQDPQPAIQAESPAQNAAGEYHYICPNGCAGGSGMAGNCSSCGTALAHNDKYHQ